MNTCILGVTVTTGIIVLAVVGTIFLLGAFIAYLEYLNQQQE